MSPELREKRKELRKLEQQAKQLLIKMDRLEADWNSLKKELEEEGEAISHTLGDILASWQRRSPTKSY